jgi:hypothetical protein
MNDSGGTLALLGPAVTVRIGGSSSVFANLLFPVYQTVGGVHQKIDFVANAGFRLDW